VCVCAQSRIELLGIKQGEIVERVVERGGNKIPIGDNKILRLVDERKYFAL
jgi:hypothetical protein